MNIEATYTIREASRNVPANLIGMKVEGHIVAEHGDFVQFTDNHGNSHRVRRSDVKIK